MLRDDDLLWLAEYEERLRREADAQARRRAIEAGSPVRPDLGRTRLPPDPEPE